MAYLSDGDTQTLAAKKIETRQLPVLQEHLQQLLEFNETNL